MVWGNFFGNISFILGGLDPCPNGLGHFFRDEVPQSARLSAGGGGQSLNGQCPNAFCAIFGGASLSIKVIKVAAATPVNFTSSCSGLHFSIKLKTVFTN